LERCGKGFLNYELFPVPFEPIFMSLIGKMTRQNSDHLDKASDKWFINTVAISFGIEEG
jgi:hypothetical protein